MNTLRIKYFALLREKRGLEEESITSAASTPRALWEELRAAHGFGLDASQLMVVVNEDFSDWEYTLEDGDEVVFIPPVAGG